MIPEPNVRDRLYTATLFIVRLASRLPADDPARKGAVHWLEREGLLTDATRCVLGNEPVGGPLSGTTPRVLEDQP